MNSHLDIENLYGGDLINLLNLRIAMVSFIGIVLGLSIGICAGKFVICLFTSVEVGRFRNLQCPTSRLVWGLGVLFGVQGIIRTMLRSDYVLDDTEAKGNY